MDSSRHIKHTKGTEEPYSVIDEARKLFNDGILHNSLISQHLVTNVDKYADFISFEGSPDPHLPVVWRFTESIAALKALEATYVNVILEKVFSIPPQKVLINTQVTLFLISRIVHKS